MKPGPLYLILLAFLLLAFPVFLQGQTAEQILAKATEIYSANPDSSMQYCLQAEEISRKQGSEEQYAFSLVCQARYTLLKGDLKASLEKLNEAIGIFQEKNNNLGLARCYGLKSILMGRLNNEKAHFQFLQKSKELYKLANDVPGQVASAVNLANAYSKHGEYDQALKLMDELGKMNLQESKDFFFIELNTGLAYYGKSDFEAAATHFRKAVQKAQQYKMVDSEITGMTYLAEAFFKLKKNKEATATLQEALKLARSNNLLVEEADALEKLINIYEEAGNYPEAYLALKRFRLLKDSLLNIEKIKSIHEIEHRLTLTEKEKIITEQKLALETENAELASSRFRGALLIGGMLVLTGAVVFLFVYLKRTRLLYGMIQVQKDEVEFQKELLEAKNKEITDSINYARYIQYGMLPSEKTIAGLFPENFIMYRPKDIVAGDFYWVEKAADGRALLAACDCTGHGVPGAMVSIVACNALNRAVKEFKLSSPSLIFDKANELMQEAFSKNDYEIKDGMDGVLCAFHKDTLSLDIVAANNPVWIVGPTVTNMGAEQDMELSQVAADKQPVGKYGEEIKPFNLKSVSLQKGEMIYLFSDGYADQFGGPNGKKFKHKQLAELLLSIAQLPLAQQKEILEKRFDEWKGRLDQVDDVLLIGVRV